MGESDERIAGQSCPGRQRLPTVVAPFRVQYQGPPLRPGRRRTCRTNSTWAILAGRNEPANGCLSRYHRAGSLTSQVSRDGRANSGGRERPGIARKNAHLVRISA